MVFHIGPWKYRVRITDDPIKAEDGSLLNGMADRDNREILISGDVPPQRRMGVLMHELQHAWLFHFPKARTEEELCEFTATLMTQAYQDFNRQGGLKALAAMRSQSTAASPDLFNAPPVAPEALPPTEPQRRESPAKRKPSARRAYCGLCGAAVAGGAVVAEAARWDHLVGARVARFSMYCSGCRHVQSWRSGVDAHGFPVGEPISEPEFVSDSDEVAAFLEQHAEAVEVP